VKVANGLEEERRLEVEERRTWYAMRMSDLEALKRR